MSVPEITCDALKVLLDEKADITIIDVRQEHELDISKIEGSVHIPLDDVEFSLDDLDQDKSYIMQCRSGGRSAHATQILMAAGFKDVRNLVGGINEWASTIDTSLDVY